MAPVLTYELVGARGGHGTTTLATVLAFLAAGHQPSVLAAVRPDDVMALAGAPPADLPMALAPNLDLIGTGDPVPAAATVAVADFGHLADLDGRPPAPGARRLLVVRGPCYLGLRTALEHGAGGAGGVVLVSEPGRALGAGDVEAVLGVPVVHDVRIDPAVARAADAGILAARLHQLVPLRHLATMVRRDLAGAGLPGPPAPASVIERHLDGLGPSPDHSPRHRR